MFVGWRLYVECEYLIYIFKYVFVVILIIFWTFWSFLMFSVFLIVNNYIIVVSLSL